VSALFSDLDARVRHGALIAGGNLEFDFENRSNPISAEFLAMLAE
jgi:hypothetical protein